MLQMGCVRARTLHGVVVACVYARVRNHQASSLRFLSEHGFSFDACFGKGVPYLSRADEESARRRRYDCV